MSLQSSCSVRTNTGEHCTFLIKAQLLRIFHLCTSIYVVELASTVTAKFRSVYSFCVPNLALRTYSNKEHLKTQQHKNKHVYIFKTPEDNHQKSFSHQEVNDSSENKRGDVRIM